MLNPFAIEKDSMLRMAAIQEAAIALRLKLCKSMLAEERGALTPKLRKELVAFVNESTPQPDRYECKTCHVRFNDGRKLGGHVSRAHKPKNEISEQPANMEEDAPIERRRIPRPRAARTRNVGEAELMMPESIVKMEKMEEEFIGIY